MATPQQKADERPISFVFHNTATGSPPVEVRLVIRPEDLTRTDRSRLSVTQTLGGAWADSFGAGVPQVVIAGHTGWGQGGRPDGLAEFQRLHDTVFKRWHAGRADALKAGMDPDKVKLIFSDSLDGFTWVVAPQAFVLRRNKARPLLSQYQITLNWLSDDVSATSSALGALSASALEELGLSSLELSIRQIESFAADLRSAVGAVLGPVRAAFASFVDLTATALSTVQRVIAAGMGVVSEATGGLLSIAGNLARAGANITRTFQSIINIPNQIRAQFSRVASAFNNAFCVLKNAFRSRRFIGNYDDLFGASTCSSTAGGRPISRYATENPFPALFPVDEQPFGVSSQAAGALAALTQLDPVLYPSSAADMASSMGIVTQGVVFA